MQYRVSDDDMIEVNTSPVQPIWSKLKPDQKFARMWLEHGYDQISVEHTFSPDRKYRLDFAWPSMKVGVEIHGFGYGHQATKGLIEDCEKMRHAIELGWTVVPFTSYCVSSKERCRAAVEYVCLLLSARAK